MGCDIETLKAMTFLLSPVVIWLGIGAVVAYTAKAMDKKKKEIKPKFED